MSVACLYHLEVISRLEDICRSIFPVLAQVITSYNKLQQCHFLSSGHMQEVITHYSSVISCVGLRSQQGVSQKPGFILLETNYRLFAYTGEAFPSLSWNAATNTFDGKLVCLSAMEDIQGYHCTLFKASYYICDHFVVWRTGLSCNHTSTSIQLCRLNQIVDGCWELSLVWTVECIADWTATGLTQTTIKCQMLWQSS